MLWVKTSSKEFLGENSLEGKQKVGNHGTIERYGGEKLEGGRGGQWVGPTCLAELRGAPAFPREPHDRHHFGTNAGAPLLLLLALLRGSHARVRLAAIRLLQVAHVPADARALGHVLPGFSRLPVFNFGRKGTVSNSGRSGDVGPERGGGGGQRGQESRGDRKR